MDIFFPTNIFFTAIFNTLLAQYYFDNHMQKGKILISKITNILWIIPVVSLLPSLNSWVF